MFKIKVRKPECRDRIAIAVPHLQTVSFYWAAALRSLMYPSNVEVGLIDCNDTPTDKAYNFLVEKAKSNRTTHIFFLEHDVLPPPDALIRLYNHNVSVVSGLVGISFFGIKDEALKTGPILFRGNWDRKTVTPLAAEVIKNYPLGLRTHEDLRISTPCLLVKVNVFDQIDKPYFVWEELGQDIYFSFKLHSAKIPMYVDSSVRCLHIKPGCYEWDGTFRALEKSLNGFHSIPQN